MKNTLKISIVSVMIVVSFSGCDFDLNINTYHFIIGSRLSEKSYIAYQVHYKNLGTYSSIPSAAKQLLVFKRDTTQFVRKDSIVEEWTHEIPGPIIAKRKQGKMILQTLTKQGKKSMYLQMLEPKNWETKDLIVGDVMLGDYNEAIDTVRTYYRFYE